jgi:predicted ABC-type ATPase
MGQGRPLLPRIPKWQAAGYHVALYFLSLPSVELAIERVKRRVQLGGHNIPEDAIRRRFDRGLMNLPRYQAIVDEWQIWDTSSCTPEKTDGS